MVTSWYDTGQRLTQRYDPEVQTWPPIGGKTGYHRMNGALPKPAWNRDLGEESPGDSLTADDAAELQAVEPHASTGGAVPEELVAWGCDAALWNRMPAGCHRDLRRFARDSIEDLARNRIATMREISGIAHGIEPSAMWERATWDKAVAVWEKEEERKAIKAKDAAKAAKKAAREAAKAAEAAEAEAAAAVAAN